MIAGTLMVHQVKSISHQIDQWFAETPNAYSLHRFELKLEDDSTFTISLFTKDLALKLESLPGKTLPPLVAEVLDSEADSDPTPWCNACGARTKARCSCGPIADNE